jgi:hypothetical protein
MYNIKGCEGQSFKSKSRFRVKNFEVKLEGIKKECETFPFPKF